MGIIYGTYINGEIVLDTQPDWPNGTEVIITPIDPLLEERPDDDDVSPDAIAHRID
jgi:hypothetical protein